jgi:hypothetical protein
VSPRAVTRVNAVQAPKRVMQEPTRREESAGGRLTEVLTSASFLQAALLLALPAAPSGLIVPYIKWRHDNKKPRLAKIVEAQAEVLDDLTEVLW